MSSGPFLPLDQFESALHEAHPEKPGEIVSRVVTYSLGLRQTIALGKFSKWYYDLYRTLGTSEFEIFIQANVDAYKDAILSRGWYAGMFVHDHNIDAYKRRREGIATIWGDPFSRYPDPLFCELYQSELRVMRELLTLRIKGKTDSLMDIKIRELVQFFPMLWAISEWKYDQLEGLLDENGMRAYINAKRILVNEGHAARMKREKARAEYHAAATVAREHLGQTASLKNIRVDFSRFMSPDYLSELVVEELMRIAPTTPKSFSAVTVTE